MGGKDFAFAWMDQNSRATKEELVAALVKDQKFLPSGMPQEELVQWLSTPDEQRKPLGFVKLKDHWDA